MVFHIQHREKKVIRVVLTTLLDLYFLLYISLSPPRFCPLLYLTLLLWVSLLRPFAPLFFLTMFCVTPFPIILLCPCRRGLVGRKKVL